MDVYHFSRPYKFFKKSILPVLGEYASNHAASQRDHFIYGVCFSQKNPLLPLKWQNCSYTWRESEFQWQPSAKNMHKFLHLVWEEWYIALYYAYLCPEDSNLARLQGAWTFLPFDTQDAWYTPWGTVTLRRRSLRNLIHRVYFLRMKFTALHILDLLLSISLSLIKLN